MPKNTIGDPPFPPVVLIDKNDLFTAGDLTTVLSQRPDGVSLCLRYADGQQKRGGYFFHFKQSGKSSGELSLYDFEKRHVADLVPAALVAFINHCAGRQFDKASFDLSQTQINFLRDD